MNRLRLLVILFFLPAYLLAYSVGNQTKKSDNQILATVGSHQIYLSQFSDRYTDYLIKAGINDKNVVRENVLINMTNELVLRYYDNNKKILNDPEYQKELKWTKKEAILAYLKDQEVYAKITATDKELHDAFVKVNERVAARHLYAPTKKQADSLYNLLMNGANFDSLAKQVFTDTTLQNNGGYLGYFTWGDMDPAFEDTAYAMKIGEISKPVKTAYGYSIIKVEDKVIKPILTQNEFLNKKDHLTQVIRLRKMKPAERAYLQKVMDVSKIKFNDDNLQKIFTDLNFSLPVELKKSFKNSGVCANYEGKKYSQFKIEQEIAELPSFQLRKINDINDLKAIVKGLMLQDTLYNIAVSKGFDTVGVVNSTYNKLVTDLFMHFKMMEIDKDATVPDSVVYQYYKDNINSFMSPRNLNVQEIILNNKILADSLVAKIENGADFGNLAKQYSIKHNSNDDDGTRGYSNLDEYGYLQDTLWNSKVGKIVGPIRFDKYYGIFKVLGKKASEPLDFNLIKDKVEMAIKKQMSQTFLQNYVNKLKKSVPIKINYDMLWAYKIPGLSNN